MPMPVPSEVSIAYLGRRVSRNPLALFATWLGLTALIVSGSTSLFAVSRRWGPGFITGRMGTTLQLTPDRIERARRWVRRWGPLAIGLARYVPGLRWAMAVACGMLGASYRTFWLSTAVSASIWAGLLLTLGVTIGDAVGRLINTHAWIGLMLPVPAAMVVTTAGVRFVLQSRAAASSPTAAHRSLKIR